MSVAGFSRKIIPPTLSPSILHRESLVAELNSAVTGTTPLTVGCKLVLLCAPAGYGKTTLLSDFASHTSFACCWYFLDSTDADKTVFFHTLIESIRFQFPHFGENLDQLLNTTIAIEATTEVASYRYETLVNELARAIEAEIPQRIAIILCSYHKIYSNQLINQIVNHFLDSLPVNCTLFIESQTIPELPLMQLMWKNQVFALGVSKLRFSAKEIGDLAQLQPIPPLSEVEIEQLNESFGGWIAGILLGTRLGHAQFLSLPAPTQPEERSASLEIGYYQRSLFEYVIQEVFQAEPEAFSFLKEVSILSAMTPLICNQLLGRSDTISRLYHLERQGLFVTHRYDLASQQDVYTLHPIIRSILRKTLSSENPEHFTDLHRRAAELFARMQEYDQAIRHAQEAGLYDVVATLIVEASKHILAKGQVETLAYWIDQLPAEVTARHPQLLVIRARVYLMSGDHTQAFPLLQEASVIIGQNPELVDADSLLHLRGEIASAESRVWFQQGNYSRAQELSQWILEQLPIDEVALRAAAHLRLGVCANLLGNFTMGIEELQKALLLWGRKTKILETADIHSALVSAYSLTGNFTLAEYHLSQAGSILDHLNDYWHKADHLIRAGLYKWREGKYAESEAAYKEALSLARGKFPFLRGEGYALVNLSRLYQDQNLHMKALEAGEEGLEIALKLQDASLIHSALRTVAEAYLLLGDIQTALMFVARINQLLEKEGGQDSYDTILLALTQGTILLYQNNYEQAAASLAKTEAALHSIGFQIEQLKAILSIAVCYSALNQRENLALTLHKASTIMASHNYEHILLLACQRHPVLVKHIHSLPEAVALREFLPPEKGTRRAHQRPPSSSSSVSVSAPQERQPDLKIYALGEPAILINDEQITRWRMPKSMELFFLLLNNTSSLRKEQIITELWPGEINDQIDQTWRSTLYYLRKIIGESSVVKKGGRYTLDLAARYDKNIWYDVDVFLTRKGQAQQALKRDDKESANQAFLEMIDLYRGDYVQSFYSDWCIFQRDRLRTDYLDARQQLALLAWHRELFSDAALHWQHMLSIDSCMEEAHYGLMRCYMQQNKRSLALRQYQRCVAVLQEELDTVPGKAIQDLYQQITASH